MNVMQRAGASAPLEVRISDKTYAGADGGAVQAVKGLALTCPAQTCTALVGPSGCGKTTILRIIAGLDSKFTGEVSFAGAPMAQARIGFIFQEPTLLPWRTVEDNIRLAAPGLSDQALTSLLAQAEIADIGPRFPGELSLGLARRVSIVRAIAAKPDLLLLDEPFVSLDEATAKTLRALVGRILDSEAVTAILVTHDLREAVELADQIITLSPRPARAKSHRQIPTPRAKRTPAMRKKLLGQIERGTKSR